MQTTELFQKFGRNDLKLIARDRFLLQMFGFAAYIAIALRFFLPWLNGYLANNNLLPNPSHALALTDYYPLIIAYMVIFQGSILTGTIFGFALLDEKDDNTIKALLVTPIPLTRYILYRVALPTVAASIICTAMLLVVGQTPLPLWQILLLSIGASPVAPIASLFYAVFAENKVQGFAMGKFIGIFGLIIIGAWFVNTPLQWLFGLFPPFWISKSYWLALEGNNLWYLTLLIGIITQSLLVWVLAKQFNRIAYR